MKYLSKSDFKAARECPTKLYYRKKNYPNLKEVDEFLELLAEGGFMVGKMAQLLFPDGIEIRGGRGDPHSVIEKTKEYLNRNRVTLFEPAIYADGMYVRADVLVKNGRCIELIEVKAKSIDGGDCEQRDNGGTKCFWKKRGKGLNSGWQPYLEDVAYQTLVLQRAFPESEIHPFLMLCDKSRRTNIDNLLQQFLIQTFKDEKGNDYSEVDFTGDIDALRQDHILLKIGVLPELEYLLPEIKSAASIFVSSVIDDKKIQGPLCTTCKVCEYRLPVDQKEKNGFLECWGGQGTVSPHLLELRNLGNIKSNGEKLANSLFANGKASLYDMPDSFIGTGSQGEWQRRQIKYWKECREWISPGLKDELAKHKYPLHFIDFETSRMALPYHANLRPYGQVAFQWSCHTISQPGNAPRHRDWINTEEEFPNIEFAQSLRECVGRDGTVFMWSHHERSVLKEIAAYIQENNLALPELVEWLNWMNKNLVDQCKIAEYHYYHPDMKGSVSIKYVLPAIWNNNAYLHEVDYLKPYIKKCDDQILSPYEALERIEIAEEAEVIQEGTGAMRAYQEMMYGLHRGDRETHKKWTELLRQYCALDTMAMVIIYNHWCSKVGI